MAFIPKGKLDTNSTAKIAVVVGVIGLFLVPILAVPAMLVAGLSWRSGPRWARLVLVAAAVVFAIYIVAAHPAAGLLHS